MSYARICALGDLPGEGGAKVDVDGTIVAVFRDSSGHIHVIDDECTHGKVSLSEGELDGCRVECWLHGSIFDLVTGKPTCLPATQPVRVYPVRLEGDEVYAALAAPLNHALFAESES